MSKETGGSAFPTQNWQDAGNGIVAHYQKEGMTLRDFFAAKAMQGMLAACSGWSEGQQERLAKCSYSMADEMLKARNT